MHIIFASNCSYLLATIGFAFFLDLFCTEKWYHVTQFILVSCTALTKLNTLSRMTQQTVDLFCTEKWYLVTQFILVSCRALTKLNTLSRMTQQTVALRWPNSGDDFPMRSVEKCVPYLSPQALTFCADLTSCLERLVSGLLGHMVCLLGSDNVDTFFFRNSSGFSSGNPL